MTQAQEVLKKIFVLEEPLWMSESASALAEMYVDLAFLETALGFLQDEQWLRKEENSHEICESLFRKELNSLSYLRNLLSLSSKKNISLTQQKALRLQESLLEEMRQRSRAEQKIFLTTSLHKMSHLFLFEEALQDEKKIEGKHLGFSLYRTFDGLDKIFELNYEADIGMKQDLAMQERLYEGAGVGVQSGYSTVLTALSHLSLKSGDRFIDLGSGYGRVGLVVGLMHPEVDFTGYEFVPHRVQISNQSSARLMMSGHVHFHAQDLSLKDFKIPEAEVYYLYDPFNAETYGHVLSQLVALSRAKEIVVITKGNARGWLEDIARNEGWKQPQEFDGSNLCVFHSC